MTPEDIRNSEPMNPGSCAVAKACKKRVTGVVDAYIFRSTAWLVYKTKAIRYRVPEHLTRELVSFDRAKIMEAAEYTLIPFGKNERLGHKPWGRETGKRTGRAPKPRRRTAMIRAGG